MAGRIRHWKHGWIPISPEAKAYVAGKGPRPTSGVRKSPQSELLLGKNYSDMTPAEKVRAAEIMYGKDDYRVQNLRSAYAAELTKTLPAEERRKIAQKAMGFDVDMVDGVEFVTYQPGRDEGRIPTSTPHRFTKTQKKEIAATVNEIRRQFPGSDPVRIVGVKDPDNFGVADWGGRRISLSNEIFSEQRRWDSLNNMGREGSLVNQYVDDPHLFAKAVVAHEMGHALMLQNPQAKADGVKLATKKVTPLAMGYTDPPFRVAKTVDIGRSPEERREAMLREPRPRWQLDRLSNDTGPQTIYGLANEWEWFAEAFADGYLHQEVPTDAPYFHRGFGHEGIPLASEAGQSVLEILHQSYGGPA